MEATDELITMQQLSAERNVTVRTLENWLLDPTMKFPKPRWIRGRRYFSRAKLAAFDARFGDGQYKPKRLRKKAEAA